MIEFRKYSENNTYFILPRDLDPELFPTDLYGPVKCGILEPGKKLIRIDQNFPPKSRFFEDQKEFLGKIGSLNKGIWVYFKDEKKMETFLDTHAPILVKEYEQLQGQFHLRSWRQDYLCHD